MASSSPSNGNELLEAAFDGNLKLLKRLVLELGSHGDGLTAIVAGVRNSSGMTALHSAAAGGKAHVCKYLIKELKLDVNIKDEQGAVVDAEAPTGTPLHWASIHGKKEAVKTLLENNANSNKLYHDVFSPLKVALLAKSSECAKLLLEAGADPNIQSSGVAALQIAASQGETEMIKCLLKAGANPNVNDYHGLTPVEVAALRGNTKDVMILFPVTSRISKIPDWSPSGIMKYINSTEATEQMDLRQKECVSFSKSKGNEAFVKKGYHYAIYWAKLKDGTRALLDAQACLSLRPDWPKAYYREGVAWNLLKQYHRAAIVFSNGLKLDPENEELQTAFWRRLKMASSSPSNGNFTGDILEAAFDGNLNLLKRLILELDGYGDGYGVAAIVAGVKNSYGRTALHSAAAGGKTHVCKYLIEELKLDVDIKDEQCETPLHHATLREHPSTATYLLGVGANPTVANKHKVTALHFAAEKGFSELLSLLITKGAVVDAEAPFGTPLQWASTHGRKEAVKILLENNANPNKLIYHVFSPLKLSIMAKSCECVKLLLEAGADPNIQSSGVTALQIAASNGETEIIKCLLKTGANPNVIDHYGFTPIEVAALNGYQEDVMILFPVTSQIPTIPEWSFDGILEHVNSTEVIKQWKLKQKEYASSSKTKGDDAFKKKDYMNATYWYTEVINSDPTDAAALSNRSLCKARLNDGLRALSDAQACLSLRPDWPKAYYREGVAWNLLKQYHNAAKSFRDGLKRDPENKELQTAFWEAEQNRLMGLSWEM